MGNFRFYLNQKLTKSSPTPKVKAIAFIDAAVGDHQSLISGLESGIEAVILDPTREGIEQIAQALQGRPHLTSVHLVSHGSPGCLYLGNSQLSLDTLERYAPQLRSWFTDAQITASPSSPALLLYGCNVAAGDAGAEFVEKLSQLTGASVAASAKRTGSAALGGDWELEVQTGKIPAPLAFQVVAREAYAGVLAMFTVDTIEDENDGGADGTGISLRDAILAANSNDDAENTIILSSGTYLLSINGSREDAAVEGDLDILDDGSGKTLTIIGDGADTTFIDASGFTDGNEDRVFHILEGATLNISGVTITGGNATFTEGETVDRLGGGVLVQGGGLAVAESTIIGNTAAFGGGGIDNFLNGTVAVTNSHITGNTAFGGGGGIANGNSKLTVIDSVIIGNTALRGGGIANDSDLTIINTEITDNTADFGGGIENVLGGTVTVTDSEIAENTAVNQGGGIANISSQEDLPEEVIAISRGGDTTVTLTGTDVVGNVANDGGGLFNNGEESDLTLAESNVTGNTAEQQGGGIFNRRGTVAVSNSDITDNTALFESPDPETILGGGGGIANFEEGTVEVNNSLISRNAATASAFTGGIFSIGGMVTVTESEFADNTAGFSGAIGVSGDLTVTNSKFTGNRVELDGGAIGGSGTMTVSSSEFANNSGGRFGGAIAINGDLTLTNSKFTGNTGALGGGIASRGGDIMVSQSEFANNTALDNGGGLFNIDATVTVSQSEFADNTA